MAWGNTKRMSKLKCKIILGTWYQETPNDTVIEVLPEEFESIDEALSFLAVNFEAILDDYPVTSVNVKYT